MAKIAVDLDGTLAAYNGWKGASEYKPYQPLTTHLNRLKV